MGAQALVPKDPSDILDFIMDWARWLASGETVSTATFTVEAGLTKVSESNTTTTATVRVSGGTAGGQYTVTCQVDTSSGQRVQRSFEIAVEER